MMKLSVIVVNYNTREILRKCLQSASSNLPKKSEVIVVDNASLDGSVEMVEKFFPQTRLIKNQQNCGFSKAVNQGLEIAKGELFLLLNSDIIVQKGAIKKLVDFAKEQDNQVLVGGQLLNLDRTPQASVFYLPGIWRAIQGKLDKYLPDNDSPQEVEAVVGAVMLIPRKTWRVIGGLDEKFFMYFEDLEYCRRARQAGFEVFYLPTAKFVHHHGASGKKDPEKVEKLLIESAKKYYGWWRYQLVNGLIIFKSKPLLGFFLFLALGGAGILGWTSWRIAGFDWTRQFVFLKGLAVSLLGLTGVCFLTRRFFGGLMAVGVIFFLLTSPLWVYMTVTGFYLGEHWFNLSEDIGIINNVNASRGELTQVGWSLLGKLFYNKAYYGIRLLENWLRHFNPRTFFAVTDGQVASGFTHFGLIMVVFLPLTIYGLGRLYQEKKRVFWLLLAVFSLLTIPSTVSYPSPETVKLVWLLPIISLWFGYGFERTNTRMKLLLIPLWLFNLGVVIYDGWYKEIERQPNCRDYPYSLAAKYIDNKLKGKSIYLTDYFGGKPEKVLDFYGDYEWVKTGNLKEISPTSGTYYIVANKEVENLLVSGQGESFTLVDKIESPLSEIYDLSVYRYEEVKH